MTTEETKRALLAGSVKAEMEKSFTEIRDELTNCFNMGVRDFVKALIRDFGKLESEFKSLYNKYLIGVKFDKTIGITMFQSHVLPFKKRIEDRDELMMTEEVRKIPIIQDFQLHNLWPEATDAKKNSVWTMMNKLTTIAQTYQSTNATLNPKTLNALESAFSKLQSTSSRSAPPQLEDVAQLFVDELAGSECDDAKKQEMKAEVTRIAKNVLPAQLEQIQKMAQQNGHDASKVRQMLLSRIANM